MTGISAVVATYNRKDELKNLFDSLTQSDTSFLELIIVDQNEDGFIDDLVRHYSSVLDIKHLKFKERQNSKARNFGAEMARHSLICFPDDDCWFDKNSLSKVLAYFDNEPKTDMLIIRWNQNPAFQLNSLSLTYKVISSFKAPIGYAAITLFMKKEIFFDLGGFDIIFGIGSYIGGGEDTELIFKIANAKKHIFYDHSIGVNHLYMPSRNRSLAIMRSRQRGIGLIYSKYKLSPLVIIRGMCSPLLKMIISFNFDSIKLYYNILVGRLEGFFYRRKQV
jgi:GT2 family glycosyltransferase